MNAESALRVHALVPWAILDAVRSLDAPPADGMEEFHEELAGKRLGTSRTVAAEIDRLRTLAEREARVDVAEATALLRLVARRSDATLVYTDAGRRAARRAVERVGAGTWLLCRLLPGRLRHWFGRGVARRLLRRHFDLTLDWSGDRAVVTGWRPPSADATPDGAACKFYGAAVAAVLAAYTDFDGAMDHDACVARGSDVCRWLSAGRAAASHGGARGPR